MAGMWWERRRDGVLAAVAGELLLWGEDPLEDPGAGELASLVAEIARQAAADTRSPALQGAGRLLSGAAEELARADRFRGAFLPHVVRHLRTAHALLQRARRHLADHHPATIPAQRGETVHA